MDGQATNSINLAYPVHDALAPLRGLVPVEGQVKYCSNSRREVKLLALLYLIAVILICVSFMENSVRQGWKAEDIPQWECEPVIQCTWTMGVSSGSFVTTLSREQSQDSLMSTEDQMTIIGSSRDGGVRYDAAIEQHNK